VYLSGRTEAAIQGVQLNLTTLSPHVGGVDVAVVVGRRSSFFGRTLAHDVGGREVDVGENKSITI